MPEVETIKNELLPCVGATVIHVDLIDSKVVSGINVEKFCRMVEGQMVKNIERRGKYLIFLLSNSYSLAIHFRMTGSLLLGSGNIDRYSRARFRLSSGEYLTLRDPRRFGTMKLVKVIGELTGKLGPEPLDESFTPEVLERSLSRHRIPIKAALLDQNIIAGIGNMYADESLFAAHIHPLRKADLLSHEEVQSLCSSIKEILQQAISNKGASVDTYIRPGGQIGMAQFKFNVAHRYGKACRVCGTSIQRIMVRSRGTYFCPECQPSQPSIQRSLM